MKYVWNSKPYECNAINEKTVNFEKIFHVNQYNSIVCDKFQNIRETNTLDYLYTFWCAQSCYYVSK